MKERAPDSVPKDTAVLPNYKLIFTGWSRQWRGGVASIKFVRGERVRGVLYEISDRDMARLDSLEGYPNTSKRLNVTVFTPDDEPVQAVTYMKAVQTEETKPSQEYLAIMQQGCRDWRLF